MKTSWQKEMKEMEELLTFGEVANILKLNKKTIYNYAAADQFFVPILKIGKSKRVRKSDLVNYINSWASKVGRGRIKKARSWHSGLK